MFEIKMENNKVILVNTKTGLTEDIIDFNNLHENMTGIKTSELRDKYIQIINNYRTIQKYTFGETTFLDVLALTSLIFRRLIQGNYRGVRALEVGSWFGCSSYFNAASLQAFSPDNYLFCMDTWAGTPDINGHHIANFENVFDHFKSVMKYANVFTQIKPIMCDSTIGIEALQNDYFDIIFIDANHTYDYVVKDVINAIKKIKVGGLLMGHDCECHYDELPLHLQQGDNKNLDGTEGYHCGVIKALHDLFGKDYKRANQSLVWYKIVTIDDKKRITAINDKVIKVNAKNILELSESLAEALSYLFSNISDYNSSINLELVDNSICVINSIENIVMEIYENIVDKGIKHATNMLKKSLIDIKVCIDQDNAQQLFNIADMFIEDFNKWKVSINNEFGWTLEN